MTVFFFSNSNNEKPYTLTTVGKIRCLKSFVFYPCLRVHLLSNRLIRLKKKPFSWSSVFPFVVLAVVLSCLWPEVEPSSEVNGFRDQARKRLIFHESGYCIHSSILKNTLYFYTAVVSRVRGSPFLVKPNIQNQQVTAAPSLWNCRLRWNSPPTQDVRAEQRGGAERRADWRTCCTTRSVLQSCEVFKHESARSHEFLLFDSSRTRTDVVKQSSLAHEHHKVWFTKSLCSARAELQALTLS